MCKGAFTWTISNAKNTSTAPTANDITDKIQGKYLTKVDNEYKWVIEKNNANLTFYSYSDNANYLYCTNADNGVRVGTGAAKVFVVDGNYLKNTQTTDPRYVGISFNTNPYSWRCYTSTTGTNIANQTLAFYAKTTTAGYQNYTTSCSTETSVCLKPKYGGDSGGTWRVVIEWYPKWQATCGGKQK
jgi:hypothetical protein